MKKKILYGISVLAIAAVAAWNVGFNSQKNELLDISLGDVETLASETRCYSSSGSNPGHCAAKVDGSGDACITSAWYQSHNCYGQGS